MYLHVGRILFDVELDLWNCRHLVLTGSVEHGLDLTDGGIGLDLKR